MGSYIISVSQRKGCYRHIRIAATATLYKLHQAILDAFEFEDDHEHAFFMDNRAWSDTDCYFSTKTHPGERVTRRCTLAKLGLSKGDQFKYLFDYGDEWIFQCKVLGQVEELTARPVVVRSVGMPPEQYPDWDVEEWEDDLDDDPPEMMSMDEWDAETLAQKRSALPISDETFACLLQYFNAAANLYGVIPVKKLLEIYNGQNQPVEEEVFYAFAELQRHQANGFFILSRQEVRKGPADSKPEQWEIISNHLLVEDVEDYFSFVRDQGNKPYKLLPKEEFLCYSEAETFPKTPQSDAMLEYLRGKHDGLPCTPEEICQMIHLLLMIDCSFSVLLEILYKMGFRIDSDQDMKKFAQLYQEMSNHTPKQVNRGYSPDEMITVRSIPRRKPFVAENQISIFGKPEQGDKNLQ